MHPSSPSSQHQPQPWRRRPAAPAFAAARRLSQPRRSPPIQPHRSPATLQLGFPADAFIARHRQTLAARRPALRQGQRIPGLAAASPSSPGQTQGLEGAVACSPKRDQDASLGRPPDAGAVAPRHDQRRLGSVPSDVLASEGSRPLLLTDCCAAGRCPDVENKSIVC
jgi:hypothetical protein